MKRPPRVYFSLRSPYSWLALERLRRERPGLRERLRFVPYWDPDPDTERALAGRGAEFHYVQMSKAKHLYLLQDTKRLAQRLGIRMAWPIDVDPWWEVPHLAWLRARRVGLHWTLFDALAEARWGRGDDICDPDVLRKTADGAGLDGAWLAEAARDPDVREEGVDCLVEAYEDDIFGIPYFRVGRHRFWGFERLDQFLAELDGPSTPPVPSAVLPDRSYDTDTPGGCG